MSQKYITVAGAREHNLKDVHVRIPRDALTVVTGLSGSGKSSLAFDTIYAEGQRRYVESLSAYARQFLELMQKPDVDQIDGLSPAISIEQKTTSKNPRSTVATVTEIYDYMRLLWARVGIPYSPATGEPITSQTVSEMVDRLMAQPEGARYYILAPMIRGRKGEYRKELAELMKKGFQRVRIDGEFHDIADAPSLDKKLKHDIEIVVDRVVLKAGLESRLAESFETALDLADGIVLAESADGGTKGEAEKLTFSAKFACPVSGFTIEEIEPRLFSFNSPQGACAVCDGLGTMMEFDPDLVVPDPQKKLRDGAIAAWSKTQSPYYTQTLEALGAKYGFTVEAEWRSLTAKQKNKILYGTKNEKVQFVYDDGLRRFDTTKAFEGVIPNLDRRWRETDSAWVREEMEKYQSITPCEACGGQRLKPEALAVRIDGAPIAAIAAKSIRDAYEWFAAVDAHLTDTQKQIAVRILKEIRDRLHFLNAVGLGYLGLDRASGTLSGGESQRIRLASQIGSGLTGVLYVLDEPSIGLHQRDNDRLLETLRRLKDLGNTVLVVEHDEDAIRTADYVIDIGPGAGVHGGKVVAAGTPDEIMADPVSLTGDYLAGRKEVPVPERRRPIDQKKMIKVIGAAANNLKTVTAEFPVGVLTCVTGVSGGGKSTLTNQTLYKAAARRLMNAKAVPGVHEAIEGLEHLDKVIDIDQSPIGRTPRSNPATYTGAFGPIRDWYAELPESKARGYKPGRFSFNVKGGRCEACQGDGVTKIEMHFLPDVFVTCDVCKGKRYNRETLEVEFKGKSIADVLDMTVEEGAAFFSAVPSIRNKLTTLDRVGLGYIKVGQQATTLSGGEAQRVKLAKELSKVATGQTLYVLDEPTTGLHFDDVRKLMDVLQELVDAGNTVVIIEHNLDVIKQADWIIDLGPEGGDGGGEIVAVGSPEEVAANKASVTGHFLAPILARSTSAAKSTGKTAAKKPPRKRTRKTKAA
ncbi:excinuclease ABC subunit UvrA [Parvularcula bermudensis]|uniref:excinuclease ABC subunit UvrA n=1 Tax=Parvularcula bermudensis TaxID=208216 RepID=UPI000326A950